VSRADSSIAVQALTTLIGEPERIALSTPNCKSSSFADSISEELKVGATKTESICLKKIDIL
jgi:hypothetical protein